MICPKFLITALLVTLTGTQRIPTACSPSNYAVSLDLPQNIFTTENATAYTGRVAVTFTVTSENVSEVVLHASASHLNVTSVTVITGNTTVNVTTYSVSNATDFLTIKLGSVLTVNLTYIMTLDFEGQLSVTDISGFYKSSYTDASNTTHYLVTTQMEATYARRAFPCFDEPSYKATFSISLTYPSGLNALANAGVGNTSTIGNITTTTVFNPTPKMSTYLVAFIVSSFTCSEGTIEGNLPYQVCSRNETSSTRRLALEVAPKIIDSLNLYLGVNYSTNMAKLDQVAIPDFSAGAMENWGLVTYKERLLLYDANESSNVQKQTIETIIAHELAHQWFGNLVTCKWWSEIFLNEGFARYFQYIVVDELFPDYEMDKQFIIKTLQSTLVIDVSTTEALRSDASTPNEISAKFGSNTYDKGASVLRMIEHVLGTTAWKAGLNTYLNRFANSSVEPNDLWTVLNATAANLPITNLSLIIENWINHPGYPVLTVTMNNNRLKISQKKFAYSSNASSDVAWYVPITLTTSQNTLTFNQTAPVAWITPTADLEVSIPGNLSWIILNNQQTGYYRVNYDANLWAGLTLALQQSSFSGIPEINRAQIVDDTFNLARGGYLTYSQILTITQFLANETSYIVWYPGFSGFGYILKRVGENSTLGKAISSHILNLSSSLIASVPFATVNESNHIYTLNQVQAQSWACKLGDSTCVSTSVQLFATYKNTSVRPNQNLRSLVYSYGLKHSTDISVDWEFLWNAYLSTSLPTEQTTILDALGCTSNKTILNAYLQKTLTDNSGIRSQDYNAVFSAVYKGSTIGIDVALDFFINNSAIIIIRYPSTKGVGNILKGIAEQITTNAQIVKLQTLITSNVLTGTILEDARAALTTAQNNYEWVKTYKSSLNSHYGLQDETTEYRLPKVCSPSNYVVNLVIPQNVFTTENATAYTGSVAVTFKVTSASERQVVLHASASHLNVTSVTLISGTTTVAVTGYSVNNVTDMLTVTLGGSLDVNLTYVMTLIFEGKLSNNDMYGFYKSSYSDSLNTTHYLVTTQMEATYARRSFPCFDEPSYKATFSFSLTYPSGLNVLANTGANSTITNPDKTSTTVFNPTPAMSTYLVAFIVSSFTCSEGIIEGRLPYQVCSRNETASTRSLALEVGPLVINSLNSYLGINYSANMAKLDQVAIPDFSAGAMENWGLVTYRERAVLYDANQTSNAYKQYIATVIAHELAHQWFGNLVTCKWWSEIFLNEGMATFFEYFATHDIFPDYELDKQFVIKVLQNIFEADASSMEPLRRDASTVGEVAARFGTITYDKGGSILRMVQHILGTSAWKSGLNTYLNQFAHSSVEPNDLWTVLNANVSVSNLPGTNLSVIMENWVNSPGYPVLSVSITDNKLRISQKRFVYSNKTSSNVTWYVPITFTTSQNTLTFNHTTPMTWVTPVADLEVPLNGSLSWIIVNNQQTGFYRVNYDANLWASLTSALQKTGFSGIPEINRAQIVDDAFNLARGGYLTYSQAFNISQFLSNETSYTVWYSGFSGFGYVLKRVGQNSTLGKAISNHILTVGSSVIASVSLSTVNEFDHIYTLKQVQAQSWACKLGEYNCINTAVELFATYRNTSVRPNKNLISIVYAYGLKHSTDISADWEFLWNAFKNTSLSTEQVTILAALGCTSNETILNAYLQKTLIDNSGIRSQDYSSVFTAVYTGSSVGVDVALDFFIRNYAVIITRYTSLNGVGNILKGIAEQITTNAQIVKLQNLISSDVLTGTVLETANAALTAAQSNYQWVETYKSDLYSYYGLNEETTTESTIVSTTTKSSAYKLYVTLSLMILVIVMIKLF